ncbi:tyrosine-type recombinase/integrase [Microvirga sp. Mcv34]|uniref:tyrosine-type recombinase/integrase n=1 Tax=Microvirga sp. Mcv34 TaxID=2926016 RepID=UPI0021C584BB|nr:tyrosine-type recombinase/integrase [Microvirga sp. Mcv34]
MPTEPKRKRASKRKKPRTLGVVRRGEPYLWLRDGRIGSDGIERGALYIIMHKGKQVAGTGCGPGQEQEALEALEDYKASLHQPVTLKNQPAHKVAIADVISRYLDAKKGQVKRIEEYGQRAVVLLEWWGERTLADIDSVTCAEYVAHRAGTPWKAHAKLGTGKDGKPARRGHSRPVKARTVSAAGARRELEDLRAAVNLAIADGLTREMVKVTLPDKSNGRERWLARHEAARMLLAAWRKREFQKGRETDKYCARHVARFLLVGLRTGTRAGAICAASFIPEIGKPWVELKVEGGRRVAIFHRKALGETEAKNKRYPTVRLPDRLVAHLWRWHHVLKQRYVVEWRGKPVGTTQRAFSNLVYELGLGDDVVRHTLRHTAATWGMQEGVDLWELAGYLGMSTEVLERRYGHHSPTHMEGARKAMGGQGRKKRTG